jgi:hypothetical protein
VNIRFARVIACCTALFFAQTNLAAAAELPIPGIDIVVTKDPGGKTLANVRTDSRGVATFTAVPAGNYSVRAQAGANKAICSTVRVGAEAPRMTPSTNGSAVTMVTLRAPSTIQVSVKESYDGVLGSSKQLINTTHANIKRGRSPHSCG